MSQNLIKTKRTSMKAKRLKSKPTKGLAINFILSNTNKERVEWMSKLSELQKNAVFVDSTIVTSDYHKFPIDRNVFAAISPYFMALYSNTVYTENQSKEVFLPDISSTVMQIIVDFVYTGQLIGIDDSNVESVIQAVNRLQITGALDYCYQFWVKILDTNNCIRMFQMSRMYYAIEVMEKTKTYILHHFMNVVKDCRDFLNLSKDEFSELLSDDRLNVIREEFTYSSIVSWISFNNQREEHFPKLLRLVRFGNSSLKFVESTVRENILVKGNTELKQYMTRVSNVLNDIHINPLPSKFDIRLHPFLRPRIPRDVLFVYGGWSAANATNTLESYDCRVNKWYNLENQSLVFAPYRAYHGLIAHMGLIYIIGGFDGRQHFNTVFTFNPTLKSFTEKSCMHCQRCYVSVALCNGFIYAMGGFDGTVRTSSAERYDVNSNQWQFIAHMNHQRSDASAASMAGKVYIAGGFNGSEVLSSAEVYDPIANEWTLITQMIRPRSGVQLVQFEDKWLFAIGGNDGIARQTSLEKYDPKTKKWSLMADMSIPRSNFASAVLESMVYVIGGFNGTTTIAEVEAYNPITNSWSEMWKMTQHKSALSACVLNELESAQAYGWLRREMVDNSSNLDSTQTRSQYPPRLNTSLTL